MSNVVTLNADIVMRLTADPALYAVAPFLEPMRDPAMRIHKKLGAHCKSCARMALQRAAVHLSNAFVKLVADEYNRHPNTLLALKGTMAKILNTQIDEVRVQYFAPGGALAEVTF